MSDGREATERNRIQGSQLYILRCERRCLRLQYSDVNDSASSASSDLKNVQNKTDRRPLHVTACTRRLIAFQQNLLLKSIYWISFWVSWSNILNRTEVREVSNLTFTQWNKNFRHTHTHTHQNYNWNDILFSNLKKSLIKCFSLWMPFLSNRISVIQCGLVGPLLSAQFSVATWKTIHNSYLGEHWTKRCFAKLKWNPELLSYNN
jgi:hypothetical protein